MPGCILRKWSNALAIMKRFALTIMMLLIQPNIAMPASSICPDVFDYECLVKNSFQVYREDFAQWWKIYNYTAEKARSCKDTKDVTLFFRLWKRKGTDLTY
jgi:hypothetical protein